METVVFYGVVVTFQKLGIDDSIPRCCNQVRLDSVGLGGVLTITNPVAVHLKNIERKDIWVLKHVTDL